MHMNWTHVDSVGVINALKPVQAKFEDRGNEISQVVEIEGSDALLRVLRDDTLLRSIICSQDTEDVLLHDTFLLKAFVENWEVMS